MWNSLLSFAMAHPYFTGAVGFTTIVLLFVVFLVLRPIPALTSEELQQLKDLQRQDPDAARRMWDHGLHEDNVFNDRLNFFIVFESVLLGIIGALYSKPLVDSTPILYLALFGLLITLLWLYAQARQKFIVDLLNTRDVEVLPEYRLALQKRKHWPLSVTGLLAYVLPTLVALIWIALLALLDRVILPL